MMEWQKQQQHQHELEEDELKGVVDGVGGLYAKVMTDEQLELLRQQISLYSSICHQLVNMHKSISAQQDLAGMRLGNLYCDPIFVSGAAHKITPRQRWTPSPMQLQILEQIFDQGNGTPTKHKIKDITLQLTQYGPISESNVYNWFQNRRARSKRKQPNSATNNNNPDSEADTEVDSPKDKKTTPDTFQTCQPKSNSFYPQIHDLGAEMLSFDAQSNEEEPMFQSYRSGINDEMSVPEGYTSYHHPL